MLVALLACLPAAWLIRGRPYPAYGLAMRRGWWQLLLAGLCVALLAKLGSVAGGVWLGRATTTAPTAFPGVAGLAALMAITFIPSIVEDIMTRGIPLASRLHQSRLVRFAAISALIYTANHLWRFDWGVTEQVRLMCMGLAYAAACWRWRSLWAAVGLHWGWNLANALAGAVWPVEWVDETAMRLAAALVHLAIFAAIALLPGRNREAVSD
ncbi:CPBP family intramembrane glutamic endopeptidase [Citromicrobium bathyomarinum]|uniref:CPBP family intramembrane glutamic endopeptidase n=1 Tax=Citromicrobium bathyomarinum TaxID=72174 RepID=UPI00315AD90D